MNDPHHVLTPELQATICAFIRSGAFPQIAAEAAGIPQKVFERWLRYGQAKRPLALYRNFAQAVRQAQAHARLLAENHALQQEPLTWLKSGPGKETARMPGWTSPIKPATPKRKRSGMSDERFMEFLACLLKALTPFPEARLAAAAALEQGGWMDDPAEPETAEQGESPAVVAETVPPQVAPVEPMRDNSDAPTLPASVPAPSVSPAANVERREGPAQGTETRAQSNSNETTTKQQPTGNETTTKPAPNFAIEPFNFRLNKPMNTPFRSDSLYPWFAHRRATGINQQSR
jgi:hypothetical protein